MNLFGHGTLSGFRGVIRQRIKDRENRHSKRADIRDAVEGVVDGTDSRIRLVSGYQKKLHAAVGTALEYADELVDRIPGAIEVDRAGFASNPYFNAFFVNFADLQSVFGRSSEIRDFLDEYRNQGMSECCALLCMRKTEKTVMGVELTGDILKKDVAQVAVSFSEHMLHSPAPTEVEAREGLKRCLFGGLVTHALERIAALRLENRRLQNARQMLNARLMHLQSQLGSNGDRLESRTSLLHDIEQTRLEISRIDSEVTNVPPLTPQQSLEQVKDVFSQPQQFVRLRSQALTLNSMGIKLERDALQGGKRLDLTEVVMGSEPPRVITLAKFSLAELVT